MDTNPNNLHCSPVQQWPGKPKEFIVLNNGDTLTYGIEDGVLTLTDDQTDKSFLISWPLIDRIDKVKVLCPQTAVAEVDTITTSVLPQTFTDRDVATYHITLSWKDLTSGEWQTKTYSVDYLTSTTWTESTFTDKFVTKINADPDAIVTASNSSNHLVLTANTAGQDFLTKVNTLYQSVAITTANRINFGRGSDFIEFGGWTTDDGIEDSDSTSYLVVEIPYYSIDTGDLPSFNRESGGAVLKKHVLWLVIQEGGTAESASLGTTISTALCAILGGTATAAKYHQVIHQGCPCS